DYNRAVILGTPTYGKATAQQVFALDTTINIEDNNEQVKADNYIKITDSKLFRINGTTAQEIGVIPDIDVSPFFAKPT
ncbi:S41 family peptidase, partial [Acinetobacter baumannii]